jgi:hypothetical protein
MKPNDTIQQAEKYLPVKQLVGVIHEQYGLTVSERFVRDMLRAGVPRVGFNAKPSVLMAWWEENKDFAPRSKRVGISV